MAGSAFKLPPLTFDTDQACAGVAGVSYFKSAIAASSWVAIEKNRKIEQKSLGVARLVFGNLVSVAIFR
jgi:hypothetical protein